VWGTNRTTVFNSLFVLQKKAVSIITLSKWNVHTAPLFHKLHILPLHRLNDFQVGCFMYRCMNALLSNHFCNMFTKNADLHSYKTRNRDSVHMTTCRLTLRKHTIRFFWPHIMEQFAFEYSFHSFIHSFHSFIRSFIPCTIFDYNTYLPKI